MQKCTMPDARIPEKKKPDARCSKKMPDVRAPLYKWRADVMWNNNKKSKCITRKKLKILSLRKFEGRFLKSHFSKKKKVLVKGHANHKFVNNKHK